MNRVLLIDDDRGTREALQGIFIRKGWEVCMTTTLAEGKAVLADYSPEWIVVAADLPDGDGVDMLRTLKASRRKCQVAIVREKANPAGHARVLGLEPDLLLTRPVNPEEAYHACVMGVRSAATG